MKRSLRIALVHAAIAHRKMKNSRQFLLGQITQAPEDGTQIIVLPEMALSGYSFNSREDTVLLAETLGGHTVKEKKTDIFTNSAVVLDPNGKMICRYDKINAETRWTCPGNPRQNNTFDTPWGKVGILSVIDRKWRIDYGRKST